MSWQATPHGYEGFDQVIPPSFETRTAGLLQPTLADFQTMLSDTMATTPGRNGSAALPGSVPEAMRYSDTFGTGGSVGAGVGDGVGTGVGSGVGEGVGDGDGLGVIRGVGVAVATGTVSRAAESAAAVATTRPPTIARTRATLMARRRLGAAVAKLPDSPCLW
jgi:hypothetical protein